MVNCQGARQPLKKTLRGLVVPRWPLDCGEHFGSDQIIQ